MTFVIERLGPAREEAYGDFLRSVPESMIFQTLAYRDFLAKILESSEARYLVALEGDRVVGALPAFLKRSSAHGNVLNSLPFYGSNGGVFVAPGHADAAAIRKALLDAFQDVAAADAVVASTIVSNPLEPLEQLYREHTGYNLEDERIGQLTPLPRLPPGTPNEAIEAGLMALIHKKSRNIVRKGQLLGTVVRHDDALTSLQTLATIHDDNMTAIGAPPKPWSVFEAIRTSFTYDRDYRVYSADLDGRTIAALLVFFHNRVCDYYTPATVAEFRGDQPGSLLIFHAMQEAVRRDCSHWNWGGTGLTQKGVYDFKSKWGTIDMRYRYYVREYPHSGLRALGREAILREYPYFFTIPFSVLAGA